MQAAKPLFDYPKYWAECFGPAPFLPMSREEMDQLGWDSCDIIIVTGDAYVDHPSFGMAIIGRLLEAQGFRVGIIAQPDWQSKDDFMKLGEPNLFFGVAAGNMDSMINRYTADKKVRSDDAYTPGGLAGKRPDRASLVYSQRCKEAYSHVPVILGGIEASLRRIAHYDYWQDKVRRSILMDATADILLYGNAERAVVEIAQRLAQGELVSAITDVRGTAFVRRDPPEGWFEIDSTRIDRPGKIDKIINPYVNTQDTAACAIEQEKGAQEDPQEAKVVQLLANPRLTREKTVIRLPSFEKVRNDPVLYAHANRVLHLETNPGNARALVQKHGEVDVWFNPPPIPMSTEEMDYVFGMPYARVPHPAYGKAKIPAYEMIRFSVNIMRGCFGGCTFCSITEHEGRIIQNRSHDSIIREIEEMRDKVPGFTGVVSDLGGPTANMYRIACKSPDIERHCRKPSCVFPGICENLDTDHSSLIELYRKARGAAGGEEDPDRLRPALRPRRRVARVRQGTGDPPRRRLPEDRPGAHRARSAGQDDEAGDRHLRPLQADVREVLEGSRQGAVPDPVLHRRPSRDHRRRHDEPGPVAQAQRLPRRPGPGVLSFADGHCHRYVSLGQEPAAQGHLQERWRDHRQERPAAAPAQGLPALPRPERLAAAARGAGADGARRPDRQWQAPPGPDLPAGYRRIPERPAEELDAGRQQEGRQAADPAYRPAATRQRRW